MTRTPNADTLNASLRTSSRKRKAPATLIISDDEGDSDYEEVGKAEELDDPYDGEIVIPAKRKTVGASRATSVMKVKKPLSGAGNDIFDIEEAASNWRPHAKLYHDSKRIINLKDDLLQWFDLVREKRAMPWRKVYDDGLSMEAKGQRAYEIWVSEVMLQQTQVTTVIPYWKTWLLKWPTVADLAKADVEEVNSAWKGLGYYRRARSLLAGAQKVMSDAKYQGRLPDDPIVLEKEIDGIGRYTAGAICSMAYGIRTPIVDGNIHRLFCRLLALYAPATLPILIKKLWSTAQELVDSLEQDGSRAGDLNQALMELGSQICKPSNPDCEKCPLRSGCNAYSELSTPPPAPTHESANCDICAPPPDMASVQTPAVTIYPMKKVAKAPREQSTAVCLIEWRSADEKTENHKWLFVKRPQKGLLAGLFEPPSMIVDSDFSSEGRFEIVSSEAAKLFSRPADIQAAIDFTKSTKLQGFVQDYVHVFSHIRMTYHVHRLRLVSPNPPELSSSSMEAAWFSVEEIISENVTTGSKNIFKEVYDPPQLRDGKKKARKVGKAIAGTKVVKVVKMPGT
ncbi:hypothetical protein QFC22_002632 [Naganishia vaughanmartiniae]|uniref:Uncharacterized protein n=1 Tax=Naganishia vaughanmartiniae TaxID=1424756 RepID=A0ACC2XCA5_9TREE|nr:hypothetical protein QFC22_002632 [Naganishia vaughanmartiniae]